jgi:hypothetical protein
MPVKTRDADETRAHLHRMWGAVAGGWAEHADFADARGAAVTEPAARSCSPTSPPR